MGVRIYAGSLIMGAIVFAVKTSNLELEMRCFQSTALGTGGNCRF